MGLINIIANIIFIPIVLILIYLVFIRSYVLARKKFKCSRCGKCCRLFVIPKKEEIEIIKKAGYKDFIEKNGRLKRPDGFCIFRELKDEKALCTIYKIRPQICRNFPNRKGIFGNKYDARCTNFYKKFF